MGDHGTKHHATPGGLFLAATTLEHSGLLGETVLDVDVAFLENSDAVAGDDHVLGRVHVHLDDDRAVDLAFDAGGGVLAADSARLVEHVGHHPTQVGTDEDLKCCGFVVVDQSHYWEPVSCTIFYRTSGSFGLVTCPVLLLRLTDYLQLRLTIP